MIDAEVHNVMPKHTTIRLLQVESTKSLFQQTQSQLDHKQTQHMRIALVYVLLCVIKDVHILIQTHISAQPYSILIFHKKACS